MGVTGRYYSTDPQAPEIPEDKHRKIMIISDCPHDTDSYFGTYFSGKHSANFSGALTIRNHYDLNDIYVTGMCKCTPFMFTPDFNRPINKENKVKRVHIEACKERLIVELAEVEPQYVIALGEKTFSFFFPKLVFSDHRGKILHNDEYNVDVLATYNPVAMAYSNKFDRIIWSDLRVMHDHIYGKDVNDTSLDAPQKDYRFPLQSLDLVRALAKRLKEVETFAFDIETHGQGLFNYKLLSIGISYKEHTGVSIPIWVKDDVKANALETVMKYEVPKRFIEQPNGFYKNGKPKIKKIADPGFKTEDRESIRMTLPDEYKYLATLGTLREIKQKIRSILDKEPPLKKYWGAQHDECMALIKDIMENDTPKGAHNGAYDVTRLLGIGIKVKNYAWDTILMHHLLEEERPNDLDSLSAVYTKDGGYKSGKNQYLQSNQTSWANIPLDVLLPYNAQDADVTFQLYKIFKPRLQGEGRLWELFTKHTMPSQLMLIDMSFRGSDVDLEWLNKTHEEYSKKMHDLLLDFEICVQKVIPNVYVVANKQEEAEYNKKWKEEHGSDETGKKTIFNINSRKQLVYLFRDVYHLPLEKQTATGDALDADVLDKFTKKKTLAGGAGAAASILLEYFALSKLDSTYLIGVRDAIDADNKIHTEFKVYGTATGRLSSRNINCQNQPDKTKHMFVPPKGYVCVNVDQSAAELHVLAWMAQDKKMMDIFEHRRDLHRETAASVFGKKPEDISTDERKIAKRVSFGTAYGISGQGLAALLEPEGVKISENQGNKYIDRWMKTYSRCASFLERVKKDFKNKGFLENPFGRRRHKFKTFSDSSKESSSERQAGNYPIQSTASDIQIYEMLQMYPTLIENGILPVFTVHDSIVMYCPYDKLEWLRDYYAKMTCRRFENDEFPGLNGCLMYTEMEVGRNYGEHVALPYDCDFNEWKETNKKLFDNPV